MFALMNSMNGRSMLNCLTPGLVSYTLSALYGVIAIQGNMLGFGRISTSVKLASHMNREQMEVFFVHLCYICAINITLLFEKLGKIWETQQHVNVHVAPNSLICLCAVDAVKRNICAYFFLNILRNILKSYPHKYQFSVYTGIFILIRIQCLYCILYKYVCKSVKNNWVKRTHLLVVFFLLEQIMWHHSPITGWQTSAFASLWFHTSTLKSKNSISNFYLFFCFWPKRGFPKASLVRNTVLLGTEGQNRECVLNVAWLMTSNKTTAGLFG